MYKFPGIPSVSSRVPAEVGALLRPMREILTAFTSGDNQVATVGGLRRSGLIGGVNGDGSFQPGTAFDATPPPAPTGLNSSGALANIILSWDSTTYSNLSHTEIWRAQTNDFSLAQLIGRGDGRIYVDNVGGAAVRYYWIRYVSRANVPGPFNAQAGVRGETGVDADYLLSVMTNQITESQLYGTLGARINLIDATDVTPGSVAQRIATEASARENGLAAETLARTTGITNEQAVRASADGALATRIDSVVANSAGNAAAIASEATTRAGADGALSSRIDTVSSQTGANTAAVQTEASTRATQTGELYAQYTVKVDVNGYVSGFGLASTAKGAAPASSFAVRADNFYIASPFGPGVSPVMPFVVRTTATTINGVAVPIGVYIADAFIGNGAITNVKIGNAAVDNAKIASLDAGKITSGYVDAARIQVGSLDAKIANLDAAVIVSGIIHQARINNASVANITIGNGQITNLDAGKITSGYIDAERIQVGALDAKIASITTAQIANATITNAQIVGDIHSSNWVYGASGWYLSQSGALYANSGEFRGNLIGAGGTFSGTLTAKEVIVTDNIIGDGISDVDIFPSGFSDTVTFAVARRSKVLVIADCMTDSNGRGGYQISNNGVVYISKLRGSSITYSLDTRVGFATLEAGVYTFGTGSGETRITSAYVLKVLR